MSQDALKAEIDQVVERYVHRLSPTDARQDALTDRTLLALASTARSCLYQGTQLAKIGRFDEAIHHLSQAAGLLPDDLFTHVALSEAYVSRYERTFKREDRRDANRVAAICQSIDPFHAHAYAVLQRTDALDRERTALFRARLTLGAVLVGLFLAVSVIF